MDLRDNPTLRGITALATRPGGSLGPFGSVAALSCELSGLTLHYPSCRWTAVLLDGRPAPAVAVRTHAERADLRSVAARLPSWKDADAAVSWCRECAPARLDSLDIAGLLRAGWLLLASIAGELELAEEKVRQLTRVAGQRLVRPRRSLLGRRWVARQLREHAETLAGLVELHRAHPTLDVPAIGGDPVASLAALLDADASMPPLSDPDVVRFRSALAEVGDRMVAQRRQVQTLAAAFPLHQMAGTAATDEVLVLVAPRSLPPRRRLPTSLPELVVLAPVIYADDCSVVLRVPGALVRDLGVRRLG